MREREKKKREGEREREGAERERFIQLNGIHRHIAYLPYPKP